MAERSWKIYKLTNKINGKIYIGQTSRVKPELRWQKGNGYKRNKILYNDIKEYGWENFDHEILETVYNREDARDEELRYIILYNTVREGYNQSYNTNTYENGRTSRGVFVFDENKKLVNRFDRYVDCAEYFGISGDNLLKAINGHYNIFNFKDYNKIFYVCWENEDYKNIDFKLIIKGRKISRRMKVLNENLETIHVFSSTIECANFYNLSSRGTVQYAIDNRTPLKNHDKVLLFVCYENEDPETIKFKTKQKIKEDKREVYHNRMYCFQLGKYYYVSDFAEEMGVSTECVYATLRHKKGRNRVKGFNICWEDEKDTFDLNKLYTNQKKSHRRVKCNETGEIFNSLAACAKRFGTHSGRICYLCQHAPGYKPLDGKYTFDYIDENYTSTRSLNKNKKIICVENNKIFNSLNEVCDYYNILKTNLSQVLNNYSKSVKGLTFKYIE